MSGAMSLEAVRQQALVWGTFDELVSGLTNNLVLLLIIEKLNTSTIT